MSNGNIKGNYGGDPLTKEEESHQKQNEFIGYIIFGLIIVGIIIIAS